VVRDGAVIAWRVPDGWAQVERTGAIVEAAELSERAALGGWFATPEEAPTLGWILLHVLGEYIQHAGHLDVVAELLSDSDGR